METRYIVLDPGQSGNHHFQNDEQLCNFAVPYPEALKNVTNQCENYSRLYEEPIDLSTSNGVQQRKDDFIDAYYARLCIKNELDEEHMAHPGSFSPEKQAEILKAACSLFSKRTRTLYQWMYPNVPKQQVKTAVANCWQSLGQTEKDFYVSQVLGRFGFHTANLMVNPQLHTMKELPPELPKPPPVLQPKRNTGELQKAISSISVPQYSKPIVSLNSCGTVKGTLKRRRAVLKGGSSKRKFVISANSEDFQDDPELSQELEKFAVKFNLSNVQ